MFTLFLENRLTFLGWGGRTAEVALPSLSSSSSSLLPDDCEGFNLHRGGTVAIFPISFFLFFLYKLLRLVFNTFGDVCSIRQIFAFFIRQFFTVVYLAHIPGKKLEYSNRQM